MLVYAQYSFITLLNVNNFRGYVHPWAVLLWALSNRETYLFQHSQHFLPWSILYYVLGQIPFHFAHLQISNSLYSTVYNTGYLFQRCSAGGKQFLSVSYIIRILIPGSCYLSVLDDWQALSCRKYFTPKFWWSSGQRLVRTIKVVGNWIFTRCGRFWVAPPGERHMWTCTTSLQPWRHLLKRVVTALASVHVMNYICRLTFLYFLGETHAVIRNSLPTSMEYKYWQIPSMSDIL